MEYRNNPMRRSSACLVRAGLKRSRPLHAWWRQVATVTRGDRDECDQPGPATGLLLAALGGFSPRVAARNLSRPIRPVLSRLIMGVKFFRPNLAASEESGSR